MGLATRVRRYEIATWIMAVLLGILIVLQVVAFLMRNRFDTLRATRIEVKTDGQDAEAILVSAGAAQQLNERDLPAGFAGVRVLLPVASGIKATQHAGVAVADGQAAVRGVGQVRAGYLAQHPGGSGFALECEGCGNQAVVKSNDQALL